MATKIRLARRWSGNAGAPVSLLSAEAFYNGVDDTLYIGFGDDGSGNATSIKAIAGAGAFLALSGAQTVAGVKTFSDSPLLPTPTTGDNSTKAATTAFVQATVASATIADGDKGDISVTGSGSTWSIDPGAVSLAKMASLPASTFIGNNTAGAATPVAMTVAQAKTLLNYVKADVGLSNVENTALSTWAGSANITTLGTVSTGTWNATTIGTNKGGTGLTAFTANGIFYASSTSAMAQLAVVNNGVLVTNGSGVPSISTSLPSGLYIPDLRESVSPGVAAAGTTQGTATALTSDVNVVTTVAASAGVVLPTASAGRKLRVINKGANPLAVYPATGAAIDALAANTAVTLPVNGMLELRGVSTTLWYSGINELTAAGALTGTLGAGQMPAHTGDVTSSAGSVALTIANDAVTNTKLANMAVSTIKGRVTAGTGDPEDLSVAQVRTLLSISNVDNTSDANKPISTATQTALDAKAPLASPTFTGTPAAPTATPGTNTTQIASTAFVQAAIAALIDAAPGALDTLNELAAALGDDPNFAATVTTGLADKLAKSANLSDLTNVATARTNLGLGSMALQNANAVNITGGTIDGVTLDGGVY